ncbi:MAG: hypothetical protein JXA71_09940 [Chitinispirillaceae bacterium]|nr:hypothetical protein [Chitinispirillaceae bacterium]
MKRRKFLSALLIIGSATLVSGVGPDTLWLMNAPDVPNWEIGWLGEAWNGSAWCGDTVDPATDSIVQCNTFDFITDTGGITDTILFKSYINFTYKFRNYWAQVALTWSGWAGIDATEYSYIQMSYKGPLPTHLIKMDFFYGYQSDSMKNVNKLGDGLGMLTASPDEWRQIIFQIPDSIDKDGITGIAFNFSNAPNAGGATSGVGIFKLDNVCLLKNADIPVRYKTAPRVAPSDRFTFTPKKAGKVTVSIYTLKGELLFSKAMGVDAGTKYSVRTLANQFIGKNAPQMRIIKIQGAGVFMNEKLW